MTTAALERWRSERCAALDSLEAVHERVTERRRGRQYATEHLNLALFARLAAEFQGFCRDLHDDAVLMIVADLDGVAGADIHRQLLRAALTRSRKLDRGNASPGNIGNDFGYLGMAFWSDVRQRYSTKGPRWNTILESLNVVRNAAAHSDAAKLAEMRSRHPLTLRTFRAWRRALNDAASGFEAVASAYLADETGRVIAGGGSGGEA
ncbi:hypothetical protein [[Mycobacterium] vasticus]|uniref:RiboL-PSP-HEPN domain-containing protein n=1 Tax=[Mycobacterium] vasticus TaxID=2875777 RepID=A0ABU5YUQ3_9MYCO|nr:hypothetical protein [Mycolicibacter sp. MYC017]MEB3068838.1 hypothetical protein [Mycolicibacter sp. MYC017]